MSREGQSSGGSERKRKEGADANMSDNEIDIYDEACSEIRFALDAYAVAVVDLSQFHLFYPAFQNTSTGGSRLAGSMSRGSGGGQTTIGPASTFGAGSTIGGSTVGQDEVEAYARPSNRKHARKTYAITDPTAPSRTPQVLFVPNRSRTAGLSKAARKVMNQSDVNRDEVSGVPVDPFAIRSRGSSCWKQS
jgi:hypothetical protein